ncbi:MAG: tetratricopeptide repeat protein [Bacteroidetes bacterium]|nr:tetratricopeptide repeat protein [Bacteroidota bacterium]
MAKQQKLSQKQSEKRAVVKSGSSRRVDWASWLLFIFSFVIYANTIPNDYNLDDELVTQNHRLTSKGISAIPEIFTSPYYEDKAGYKYEYRPIVLVSFAIEHTFFGDNPHVSHFFNVLLYALLCVLLFKTLKLAFKSHNGLFPLLAAILFAAHPIHTEVVASIKNRDEIFALIFGLLSWRYAMSFSQRKSLPHLFLVPLFFYLGILSKSTTISFVLLVPVSVTLLSSASFGRIIMLTVVLLIPAILYARLYSVFQQLVLSAAVLLAVTALYTVKHFRFLIPLWRENAIKIYNQLQRSRTQGSEVDYSLDFGFLQNPLVLLSFTILMLLPFSISVIGIHSGNIWMTVLPFVFLTVSHQFVRKELQLALIVPIAFLGLIAIVKLHYSPSLIEYILLVFIALQILSGNARFRFLGTLVFLIYALTAAYTLHSFNFLIALSFVGFMNRRFIALTLVMSIALVLLAVFNIYTAVSIGAFNLNLLAAPFVLMAIYMLWINKQHLISRASVMLLPVSVALYFLSVSPVENNDFASTLERTYYTINEIKAADLTPVQSVRPIKYIEYPLESTDPYSVKIGTAMLVLGKYFRLALLPYPMSFYYGYSYIKPTPITAPEAFVPLIIFILLLASSLWLADRNALLSWAVLFFLISIAVFSNLTLPIPGMLGDRFLLIPSIGFSVLLAWIIFKLFRQDTAPGVMDLKSIPKPFSAVVLALLVIYSFVTLARNSQWKDRLTLFKHDITVVDSSAQAHNLLGVHLLIASANVPVPAEQTRMREEAATHFKKAIEIYPPFLNATYDLGRTYELLGRMDEALAAYQRTTEIDSNFVAPCFNMALYYHNKEDLDKAIPLYEKYISKYPFQKEVYANLSYAYFKKGNFTKSIETNQRLLKQQPNTYEPNINIAKTFLQLGNKDSAFVYFEKSFMLNATDVNLINSLYSISAEKGWRDKEAFYRSQLARFNQPKR